MCHWREVMCHVKLLLSSSKNNRRALFNDCRETGNSAESCVTAVELTTKKMPKKTKSMRRKVKSKCTPYNYKASNELVGNSDTVQSDTPDEVFQLPDAAVKSSLSDTQNETAVPVTTTATVTQASQKTTPATVNSSRVGSTTFNDSDTDDTASIVSIIVDDRPQGGVNTTFESASASENQTVSKDTM